MALYAIGDTHLSLASDKPMDVFGGGWEGYVDKLREGFAQVEDGDTVVLCGDLSWAMGLEEGREDFAFLDSLPGRKLMLKGNHDYWWNTAAKMNRFFQENGFASLNILHNNCYEYGAYALCGTRGWFYEETGDQKCFLHYPPCYQGYVCREIIELLERYGVERCFYGHLHGGSHRLAVEGRYGQVDYHLVAADYLGFRPQKICG